MYENCSESCHHVLWVVLCNSPTLKTQDSLQIKWIVVYFFIWNINLHKSHFKWKSAIKEVMIGPLIREILDGVLPITNQISNCLTQIFYHTYTNLVSQRAKSFMSFKAHLHQDIINGGFVLMEHFLEGFGKLTQKISICYSSHLG